MVRVIKAWTASYSPALRVTRAERITPGKLDDEFPGWQWVVNDKALGGWVPAEMVGQDDRMRGDFDTTELTVAIGDDVVPLKGKLGWSLCQNATGKTGWVPKDCLATPS